MLWSILLQVEICEKKKYLEQFCSADSLKKWTEDNSNQKEENTLRSNIFKMYRSWAFF